MLNILVKDRLVHQVKVAVVAGAGVVFSVVVEEVLVVLVVDLEKVDNFQVRIKGFSFVKMAFTYGKYLKAHGIKLTPGKLKKGFFKNSSKTFVSSKRVAPLCVNILTLIRPDKKS